MKYSIETLYHFNCTECKNWWSYANSPDLKYTSQHDPRSFLKPTNGKPGRTLTCPHCGVSTSTHTEISGETDMNVLPIPSTTPFS